MDQLYYSCDPQNLQGYVKREWNSSQNMPYLKKVKVLRKIVAYMKSNGLMKDQAQPAARSELLPKKKPTTLDREQHRAKMLEAQAAHEAKLAKVRAGMAALDLKKGSSGPTLDEAFGECSRLSDLIMNWLS